jgi:hypothetical protein
MSQRLFASKTHAFYMSLAGAYQFVSISILAILFITKVCNAANGKALSLTF